MARQPRPITGGHLRKQQENLGLSSADMCWMTGMSPNKWSEVVNANYDSAVPDEAVAIMARALDASESLLIVPKSPDMNAVLTKLREVEGGLGDEGKLQRDLPVLFGRDVKVGYNWLVRGMSPNPVVRHLAWMLLRAIEQEGPVALENWRAWVRAEARSRGHSGDIFEDGKWPSPNHG